MRKELKITEGIFPMPVLMVATYNEDGTVNVMNAAWGTMQERDTVALNLTESHKTVKNIHNQIHQHIQQSYKKNNPLDNKNIPSVNRGQRQHSKAGNVKKSLRYYGPCNQTAKGLPYRCKDHRSPVLQCIAQNHTALF